MATSTGFAMNVHYCMGERVGQEITFLENGKVDKCPKCGMKERKSGCCGEEQSFVKLHDVHKAAVADVNFQPQFTGLCPVVYPFISSISYPDAQEAFFAAPELKVDPVPIFVHNCSFLI